MDRALAMAIDARAHAGGAPVKVRFFRAA